MDKIVAMSEKTGIIINFNFTYKTDVINLRKQFNMHLDLLHLA